MFGLMRLSSFFRRFDSSRDKLRAIIGGGSLGREVYDAKKIYFGYYNGTLYLDGFAGKTFPSFQKRKGDVFVCKTLGFCQVPGDLIEDMRFAEIIYKNLAKTKDTKYRGSV